MAERSEGKRLDLPCPASITFSRIFPLRSIDLQSCGNERCTRCNRRSSACMRDFLVTSTLLCVLYEARAVILEDVKIGDRAEDKLETGSLTLQVKDKIFGLMMGF